MKQLFTILLCLFTLFAEAQVNTNDTNKYFKSYDYGFSYKRLQAREAFIMPTDTVINKLGAVSLNGAIYLGNGVKWTSIGGGTDTTSLSNRINQRIDSLRRRSDSVFARKNGVFVFQYKDSVGTTPTLQQVTTAGATTTNNITVNGLTLGSLGNGLDFIGNTNQLAIRNVGTFDNLLEINYSPTGSLKWGGGTYPYVEISNSTVGNVNLTAPGNGGIIPISVNGYTANLAGNITIPITNIDTTNQFVKRLTRIPGKDSIIYFVGANRFAIKDSVGTNPAPVGYYGSFYDTTLQSAAVINTAYGIKLGVTDLTNGVSVANNSKIKFANAGIYNIQFSLQLEKTGGSGNMIADIWLRKNNVNLVGTNGKIVLTGSANASPVVAAWNYVVEISSNDSLELMWAVDNINVKIITAAATSPHPSTASAILTVTQQSGIMAGSGISPLDTANMLIPYLRKIDTLSLSNRINLKLNISDTSTMLTKYLRKTDTSTLSNRIDLKLNISDTSTMLTKYLRKTDTATLSNRINLKLNIADTSTLQPKSISSYTILANKTSATANVTAQAFRDTSGVYDGTIAWTGTTAPSGATNHSYRLTQVGKCVTLNIVILYAVNAVNVNALTLTLPSNAPTPVQPTGLTSALQYLYPLNFQTSTSANVLVSGQTRGMLRNNTANNGFEMLLNFASISINQVNLTLQYWTN
jgi:hypothetical protein